MGPAVGHKHLHFDLRPIHGRGLQLVKVIRNLG